MNKMDLDLMMIELCEPTPSHEELLLHRRFARESDTFKHSLLMSSLGPTQPDSDDHIFILSVPDSANDAVFLTPPENHFRSSSGSADLIKRLRVSSQDEAQSKKLRQFDETLPIDTEVVMLDDSDFDIQTLKLGDDDDDTVVEQDTTFQFNGKDKKPSSVDCVNESLGKAEESIDCVNEGLRKDDASVDCVNVGLRKDDASVDCVNVGLGKDEASVDCINVGLGKHEASVNCVNEGKGSENMVIETSNVCVFEKVVGNGKKVVGAGAGEGSSCNGFDEIDKFVYNGNCDDADKRQGRRKLPKSVQGVDDNVCDVEKVVGAGEGTSCNVFDEFAELLLDGEDNVMVDKEMDFYDILEMMKVAVGDGDEEEVDFVETARQRGIVFPRPRWWHPEW